MALLQNLQRKASYGAPHFNDTECFNRQVIRVSLSLSLPPSPSLRPSLSLHPSPSPSLSLFLSLSPVVSCIAHTNIHTLSFTHTHTHTHPPSRTRSHSLNLFVTHSLTHPLTHAPGVVFKRPTHKHTLSLSLTHTHTPSSNHCLSHSLTLTHSLNHSLAQQARFSNGQSTPPQNQSRKSVCATPAAGTSPQRPPARQNARNFRIPNQNLGPLLCLAGWGWGGKVLVPILQGRIPQSFQWSMMKRMGQSRF